jgi:hypothetical protein
MLALALLLLVLVSPFPSFSPDGAGCPVSGQKPGYYSELSVSLCFQDFDAGRRHLVIPSPDGSIELIVDGQDGSFHTREHTVIRTFATTRDEEIVWSPDSQALIFTQNWGAAGPAFAGIGFVHEDRHPEMLNISQAIRRDFAARHPDKNCHGDANVGGLTWLDGSGKAVLVAEIPPTPGCRPDGGYFDTYVVTVPEGSMVARYLMHESVKRWKRILGPTLRDDLELQPNLRRNCS